MAGQSRTRRRWISWAVVLLLGHSLAFTARAATLEVVTTEDGRLAVVDSASGRTLHAIAKPDYLVREMFALDSGNIVATTQKDFTDFYDASTGKLRRRFDERIYAFSHDQTVFVTFTAEHELVVREYPSISEKRTLGTEKQGGPSKLLFSPDDRYLAVEFCNHYPLSDEFFQNPAFNSTLYWLRVFDLQTGQPIPEIGGALLGRFSADSRSYVSGDDGRQFDLVTRRWQAKRNGG